MATKPNREIEPKEEPETPEVPAPAVPLTASEFDAVASFEDGYRSMLDHPAHPLRHLKDA